MPVASNTINSNTTFGEWVELTNILIRQARSVSNTIPDSVVPESAVLQYNIRDLLNIDANDAPDFDNQGLDANSYLYLSSMDQDLSSNSDVQFGNGYFEKVGVSSTTADRANIDGRVQFGANDFVYTSTAFDVGDQVHISNSGVNYFPELSINTRESNDNALNVNGSMNATANVYEQSTRVYSPNYFPLDKSDFNLENVTNDEQVPKSGGEFTGDVRMNDNFTANTILVNIANTIYELVTNTYNIQSIDYYDKSFTSGSSYSVQSITFNDTGLRFYTIGVSSENVTQYDVSEAYQLVSPSTAGTFDPFNASIFSGAPNTRDVKFSNDGSKMFILANPGTDPRVYQLTCSTPFDVTTASYDNAGSGGLSFNFSSQDPFSNGITFNDTGLKMYMIGSGDSIYQYSLGSAFDLTSVTYDSVSYATGSTDNSQGLVFNNNGSTVFTCSSTEIFEIALSTPYDISTATAIRTESMPNRVIFGTGIAFNSDGMYMYISDDDNSSIWQFSSNELRLVEQ